MSRKIIEVLKYYNELRTEDPESELVQIKADLDRALIHAPLDEEERALILVLYLMEPTYPTRGKPDKNGNSSGRPPGGTTQAEVAKFLAGDKSPAARENKTSRVLKRAAQKISDYLGEGYE